jgi:hypothetical protein
MAAWQSAEPIWRWQSAPRSLEPGAITVPIRTFGDLVALLGDTITLTTNGDTPTLKVECDKTRANVKGIPADEFVLIPDYPALQQEHDLPHLVIHPVDLQRALARTIISAAKDQSRLTLEAVYFHKVNDHLSLSSSDGFRLSVQHMPDTPMSDFPNLLIPRSSLLEVQRLLANETEPVQIQYAPGHSVNRRQLPRLHSDHPEKAQPPGRRFPCGFAAGTQNRAGVRWQLRSAPHALADKSEQHCHHGHR